MVSIIPIGSPVFQALIDERINVFETGPVIQIQTEALAEFPDCIFGTTSEAIQILIAQLQHFHQKNDFVAVFSEGEECSVAQASEYPKEVGIGAAKECYKLSGQFEWGALETSVLSRRRQEEKAEINVNQVASIVQQNIPVVTILDLQEEANH